MTYVNTASDYTPSAAWARGNRIWIAHGNRELSSTPFAGLGADDTLAMAGRLSVQERAEMTRLINQQLMALAPAQRAKILAEAGIDRGVAGLGDGGIGVATSAINAGQAASAVQSSIFTAANIAGAANALAQIGTSLIGLRLGQIDKNRQADAADVQTGAALATAAAKQQEAEEAKKQTKLLEASLKAGGGGSGGGGGVVAAISKNKGLLIGGGIGALVLGVAAIFLIRRRRGKK